EFEFVSHLPINLNSQSEPLPLNLSVARAPRIRPWMMFGLPRYLRRQKIDLFHGTNFEVPFASSCPTVLTIHDLSLWLHPETHQRGLVRRSRILLPRMLRRASQ